MGAESGTWIGFALGRWMDAVRTCVRPPRRRRSGFDTRLVPGLAFLVVMVIAWRTHVVGSILLIVTGLVVGIGMPTLAYGRGSFPAILSVAATMAVPPLVASMLLLASRRKRT